MFGFFAKLAIKSNIKALGTCDRRSCAIDNLVQIGAPAVEPLVAALENRTWREGAALALGRIGGERALQALTGGLESKDGGALACIAGLEDLRQPAAIPVLIRMLDSSQYQQDRARRAAEALARYGEPAHAQLVAILADSGRGDQVRHWAAFALRHGGWKAPNNRLAVQCAIRLADWSACSAFGSEAIAPLAAELEEENLAWDTQRAILNCLAAIGDARAVPHIAAFRKMSSDKGWQHETCVAIRRTAVEGLARFGRTAPAVEGLVRALNDSAPPVAELAARMLDQIGWTPRAPADEAAYRIARGEFEKCVPLGRAAVQPLLDALARYGTGCSGKHSRKQIVTALGKMGDARAIPTLTEAARRDASPGVRSRANRSIDWINAGVH